MKNVGQYNFKAQNWYGLNRFGNVFISTGWKAGQSGIFMHHSCYVNIYLQQFLNNTKKRQAKLTENAPYNAANKQYSSSTKDSEVIHSSAKLMRLSTGLIHDKELCVWCRKHMQT